MLRSGICLLLLSAGCASSAGSVEPQRTIGEPLAASTVPALGVSEVASGAANAERAVPSATTALIEPWRRNDSFSEEVLAARENMWGDSGDDSFGAGIGEGGGRLRMGATTVSGRLPPEIVQRIARRNFGRFRPCYGNGLRKDPTLSGTVSVSFEISPMGETTKISATSDMKDKGVVACLQRGFSGLMFPQPEGGVVKVTYPILFSPGD